MGRREARRAKDLCITVDEDGREDAEGVLLCGDPVLFILLTGLLLRR